MWSVALSQWSRARQVRTRRAWHLYSESVHPDSKSAGSQTSEDALGSRVEITFKSNLVCVQSLNNDAVQRELFYGA